MPIRFKDFQHRTEELRKIIQQEVEPFPKDTKEKQRRRKARALRDRHYFYRTYLPHYFDCPSCMFHRTLDEFLSLRGRALNAIAGPREHAKSTICSFGYPIHQACFGLRHFFIEISDTQDLAADFLGFIQIEFEENERLKGDFGEQAYPGFWEQHDFIVKNGMRFLALGYRQPVRGIRHRQHRPDLIVLDDLENDRNVQNPRIVKHRLQWVKSAVYGSLAQNGTMLFVGNLLSKRSALAQIIAESHENPEIRGMIFRAIKENGRPLWAGNFSLKHLHKIKRTIGSVEWARDWMNQPGDVGDLFQEEWIHTYEAPEIAGRSLSRYTFIDPSVDAKRSSNFKAIITIGVDGDVFYVLHAWIRRASIDRMVAEVHRIFEEYHPAVVGLEVNAFQKLLFRDFDRMAQVKGFPLPIRPINHTMKKELRVEALSPLHERGQVRYRRGHSDQDLLIEQLLSFPSPLVEDDGPDALAGCYEISQRAGVRIREV